ncbi:MAG: carbohydrate ABC transporter permease [Anaerolineaceae bacterium]|nr:MAG: carbohydrate ABC transporter permease [Anaerolineaceae bacterium]
MDTGNNMSIKNRIKTISSSPKFVNNTKGMKSGLKQLLIKIFSFIVILGICYVILAPVIGMIVNSFMSDADKYNPMVYMIPTSPTLEKYKVAWARMDYLPTMGRDLLYSGSLMLIQVFVCSMVGYGFARFHFPFKKLLFACVVVMIVIPDHTIMLPIYMTFKNFDPLGLATLIAGTPLVLMSSPIPMYIMTIFGCGVRSGLYIYIFNQFFRGLPKEIEEAALVDGAGTWYTYFRIMLVNAIPAVITVAVFSMVWQYNDTFYAKLFLISENIVISKKISTLQATIANVDRILDTSIQELYLDAGIVLVMLPIVIIYIALQKYFIEGVERSGIVG